jgi:hypothetical protein
MRIKRGRADKANFLKMEQERRALEEERIRHETERKQWEKERQRWEDEKRVVEEEKRKRQYAQEVVAARKRRESRMYKHGSTPIPGDAEYLHATYSRPQYDSQRRQVSEPTIKPQDPRDHSPASSQGTSRTRVDSIPQSTHSRPESLYSTHTRSSSEEMHFRDMRGRSSKRNTPLSESARHSLLPQQMVPYAWAPIPPMSAMSPIPPMSPMSFIPAMPTMPYYTLSMDNMPLLPPTAPFMMHQNGSGRRSQNSSSSSRKSDTPPLTSQSAERLPRPTPPKPKAPHQRHSSGDIEPSKRLPVASRPSPSASSTGHNDRAPHSRPPPFQPPLHASYGYSTSPRPQRRQTAIT